MKDLDNWQPYKGEYPKAFLDIILHDGTRYEQVWPNAGQFHVSGKSPVKGSEVSTFRRSEGQQPLRTAKKRLFNGRSS